jgi:D-glycero-D-manno-heptose 1,7-bisphosphate phosphatase
LVFKKRKTKKKVAFFLDRDGVINHENGYIKDWNKIRLYKNTFKALKLIQGLGFLIFIITNQSIIARKIAKKKEIQYIHNKLTKLFLKKKIKINKIYFCPHHPKFDKKCSCRKPKNGLIIKARNEFNIDLKNSWLVGDKTSDIKAGKISNLKTILVRTGYGGLDGGYKVKPDYINENLYKAVKKIHISK